MYTRSFRDLIDKLDEPDKSDEIPRYLRSLDTYLKNKLNKLGDRYSERSREELVKYLFWWIERKNIKDDKSITRAIETEISKRVFNEKRNTPYINRKMFVEELFNKTTPESFMEYLLGQEQWEILQDDIRQKDTKTNKWFRECYSRGKKSQRYIDTIKF